MKTVDIIIEELIEYGKVHLGLFPLDSIYAKNQLLHLLECEKPYEGELNLEYNKNLEVPDSLLDDLKFYLISKNAAEHELICAQVMGMITPAPSIVGHKVLDLEKEKSGSGLDYLYDLSIKNNYIIIVFFENIFNFIWAQN